MAENIPVIFLGQHTSSPFVPIGEGDLLFHAALNSGNGMWQMLCALAFMSPETGNWHVATFRSLSGIAFVSINATYSDQFRRQTPLLHLICL
jgi:hypothetical protein